VKRPVPFLLASLLAGLLLGTAAGVIAASGTPTIHACVQTGGVMRYTSTGNCKAGEKLLTWNVQGLPGNPGPSGAPGMNGTSSTGSPPGAFYLTQGGGLGFTAGAPTTVVTMKLPAGGYLLQFSVSLTDADAGGARGLCWTTTDPNGDSRTSIATGIATAGASTGGSTAQAYASFTETTTVFGRCSLAPASLPSAPIQALAAQLVATLATRLPSLP
jgi:hypothetical protein